VRLWGQGGYSTDITNSDADGIVPFTMRSHEILVASNVYTPITIDNVMIPDILESSVQVPSSYVLHGVVLTFGCRTTMNDYLFRLFPPFHI